MLISGDTLISNCHGAMIYMEGEEYRCTRCMKPCKSAGTLSEKHERDNAIPKEHQRLQSAVVEAAKAEVAMERAADRGSNTITRTEALIKMQRAMKAKREAVDALIAFEAEHKIGEK